MSQSPPTPPKESLKCIYFYLFVFLIAKSSIIFSVSLILIEQYLQRFPPILLNSTQLTKIPASELFIFSVLVPH